MRTCVLGIVIYVGKFIRRRCRRHRRPCLALQLPRFGCFYFVGMNFSCFWHRKWEPARARVVFLTKLGQSLANAVSVFTSGCVVMGYVICKFCVPDDGAIDGGDLNTFSVFFFVAFLSAGSSSFTALVLPSAL